MARGLWEYDENGNVTHERRTCHGGDVTTYSYLHHDYTYDEYNNPIDFSDGNGLVLELRYDASSNLLSALNPNSQEVNGIKYDEKMNPVEITPMTSGTPIPVPNGSFERVLATGLPENWVCTGHTEDMEIAVDGPSAPGTLYGQHSLKMRNGIATDDLVMSTPFMYAKAGQQTLTADLYLDHVVSSEGRGAAISISFTDTGGFSVGGGVSPYYTGTGHIRVSVVATADTDAYKMTIRLYLSHATGTVWFDGVDLQMGGRSSFNSVENAAFGNGGGWTAQFVRGSGTYTRSTTDPWQSSYGKLTSTSPDCEAWLSQDVPVNDRMPLTVAGMVRTSGADLAEITVQFYDAAGAPLGNLIETRGLSGDFDWLQLACRADPPPGSTAAKWSFVFRGPPGSYACVDNAELIQVSTTRLEWDADGNYRTASTDPCDNRTEFAYDVVGNRLAVVDPEAHTTPFTYDAMNRILTATDALGHTSYSEYDAGANLLSWRDPRSIDGNDDTHKTSFDYGPRGEMVRVTDPLGFSVVRSYDLAGNLLTATYPNGSEITCTYDSAGRMATKTVRPENRVITYSYDGCGNVVGLTDDRNGVVTTYTAVYDEASRLLSQTRPVEEGVVTQKLDQAGNILEFDDGLGLWHYAYNCYGKLTTARVDGNSITYYYDDRGRVYRARGGKYNSSKYALERSYEYLPNGWLERITDGTALPGQDFSYEYDGDGNIVGANEAGLNNEYAYDAKHQLIWWRDHKGNDHNYGYDAAGNITNMDGTPYTYNEANQITNPGFVYDANGNMLSDGAKTYEYDGENRLVG